MYRRYYSYNDMPTLPNRQKELPIKQEINKNEEQCIKQGGVIQNSNILGRLEKDDIILLIVIFILVIDDCDDKLLLLALAFIFFNI